MQYTQDSRNINSGDIFIAFVGENTNGHRYIEAALAMGAGKIIYQDHAYDSIIPDNKKHYVKDTNTWLHNEVQSRIKDKDVTCVTGSVGKTTTLKLLTSLVKEIPNKYQTSYFVTSPGINTLRGICLEILNNYKNEKLLLLETGADTYCELDVVARVLRPSVAAITNIDVSHIEKIGSVEKIARTKFGLCSSEKIKTLVLNGDDKNTNIFLNNEYQKLLQNKTFYTCTLVKLYSANSYTELNNIEITPSGFSTNLNIAILVFSAITQIDVIDAKLVQEIATNFKPKDKRFEIINFDDGILLNDCYNAAPKSFELFFEYISSTQENKKKLGIIGQINEIGPIAKEVHKNVFEKCLNLFDYVLFVGNSFEVFKDTNKHEKYICVGDYESANEALKRIDLQSYGFIGIKGSRGVRLENCTEYIVNTLKSHTKDL